MTVENTFDDLVTGKEYEQNQVYIQMRKREGNHQFLLCLLEINEEFDIFVKLEQITNISKAIKEYGQENVITFVKFEDLPLTLRMNLFSDPQGDLYLFTYIKYYVTEFETQIADLR